MIYSITKNFRQIAMQMTKPEPKPISINNKDEKIEQTIQLLVNKQHHKVEQELLDKKEQIKKSVKKTAILTKQLEMGYKSEKQEKVTQEKVTLWLLDDDIYKILNELSNVLIGTIMIKEKGKKQNKTASFFENIPKDLHQSFQTDTDVSQLETIKFKSKKLKGIEFTSDTDITLFYLLNKQSNLDLLKQLIEAVESESVKPIVISLHTYMWILYRLNQAWDTQMLVVLLTQCPVPTTILINAYNPQTEVLCKTEAELFETRESQTKQVYSIIQELFKKNATTKIDMTKIMVQNASLKNCNQVFVSDSVLQQDKRECYLSICDTNQQALSSLLVSEGYTKLRQDCANGLYWKLKETEIPNDITSPELLKGLYTELLSDFYQRYCAYIKYMQTLPIGKQKQKECDQVSQRYGLIPFAANDVVFNCLTGTRELIDVATAKESIRQRKSFIRVFKEKGEKYIKKYVETLPKCTTITERNIDFSNIAIAEMANGNQLYYNGSILVEGGQQKLKLTPAIFNYMPEQKKLNLFKSIVEYFIHNYDEFIHWLQRDRCECFNIIFSFFDFVIRKLQKKAMNYHTQIIQLQQNQQEDFESTSKPYLEKEYKFYNDCFSFIQTKINYVDITYKDLENMRNNNARITLFNQVLSYRQPQTPPVLQENTMNPYNNNNNNNNNQSYLAKNQIIYSSPDKIIQQWKDKKQEKFEKQKELEQQNLKELEQKNLQLKQENLQLERQQLEQENLQLREKLTQQTNQPKQQQSTQQFQKNKQLFFTTEDLRQLDAQFSQSSDDVNDAQFNDSQSSDDVNDAQLSEKDDAQLSEKDDAQSSEEEVKLKKKKTVHNHQKKKLN